MTAFDKAWRVVKELSRHEREIAREFANPRDFPYPGMTENRLEYDTYHDAEGPNICSHCKQGNFGPDIGRLDAEGICPSCWEEASFGDWEDYSPPPGLREKVEAGETWQSSNPELWALNIGDYLNGR